MAGFKENAPGLLACVLVLMIPGYVTLGLRVYVRLSKKAWGPDDWCMAYAGLPFFVECLSGILAAYYGLGQHEAGLSPHDLTTALLWWNIFSFFYCNCTLPIKLGIAFQLCRIAERNRRVLTILYTMMVLNSLTLVMVFIFQLAQCHPVAYNWDKTIPGGHCLNQRYLSVISYTMSGVNITSDWVCALLPIPLLWNVQMNIRKKILVGVLLGLGVLGSIAALVRLKYTAALANATDFTFNLGVLACWTIAEPGIGFTVGNLATLRPLFKRLLQDRSTGAAYGSDGRSTDQWHSHSASKNKDYVELAPGTFTREAQGKTEISARVRRANSSSSILRDDETAKYMKQFDAQNPPDKITVNHEVQITHEMV